MLRKQKYWDRLRAGKLPLRVHTENTLKNPPTEDYRGRWRVMNQNLFLLDETFSEDHERHQVLWAHCFRLADGEIGSSGLFDPKEIIVGDILYGQLKPNNPHCELCETGDMIPREERFRGRHYAPETEPMNLVGRLCVEAKMRILRRHDRWDQRTIRKLTVPQ